MYRFAQLLTTILLLALGTQASAQVIDNPAATDDCLQFAPAALDAGDAPLDLSVAILLDGVSISDGQDTLQAAQAAFTRLNVRLAASFDSIQTASNAAQDLIAAARSHFGGARPAGADIVYLLTSKDINDDGVAGQADCIGGIRFADRAFAIGEFNFGDGAQLGPVTLQDELAGKVMAHEIGHLLGSHHHQSNCNESAVLGTDNDGCTLMINDVGLASLVFSSVNGSISRGLIGAFGGANRSSQLQNGESAPSSGGGSGSMPGWLLIVGMLLMAIRRLDSNNTKH